jgi:hypothetical protein
MARIEPSKISPIVSGRSGMIPVPLAVQPP